MRGYSLDLRERIVVAIGAGQSKTAVSERFGVSLSTVKRYLKRQAQGELAASHHPGRPWRLDGKGCEQLRRQVKAHHDWSLEQHASKLSKETGIEIRKSLIGNYLKRLEITYKKRASVLRNETTESEQLT